MGDYSTQYLYPADCISVTHNDERGGGVSLAELFLDEEHLLWGNIVVSISSQACPQAGWAEPSPCKKVADYINLHSAFSYDYALTGAKNLTKLFLSIAIDQGIDLVICQQRRFGIGENWFVFTNN